MRHGGQNYKPKVCTKQLVWSLWTPQIQIKRINSYQPLMMWAVVLWWQRALAKLLHML
jgi:hypothetical protein